MELLTVIAIIAILAALLLPVLGRAKLRAKRIWCVNNLEQIGPGFHTFANDHNGRFPMAVSTNDGGSLEYVQDDRGTNAISHSGFRHFQTLAGELSTPRILICPVDTRQPAASFARLQNENVSYFVGVDADSSKPTSVLAGDRNLAAASMETRTFCRSTPGAGCIGRRNCTSSRAMFCSPTATWRNGMILLWLPPQTTRPPRPICVCRPSHRSRICRPARIRTHHPRAVRAAISRLPPPESVATRFPTAARSRVPMPNRSWRRCRLQLVNPIVRRALPLAATGLSPKTKRRRPGRRDHPQPRNHRSPPASASGGGVASPDDTDWMMSPFNRQLARLLQRLIISSYLLLLLLLLLFVAYKLWQRWQKWKEQKQLAELKRMAQTAVLDSDESIR